jgi:hypothetical protein
MGSARRHIPVKLVIGCIYKEESVYRGAVALLVRSNGRVDFESEELAFTHTDYYEREFGRGLKKKFLSFKSLIPPEKLAAIKLLTNRAEKRLSRQSLRRINLDPGYLDYAKFILATTKDYAHRIYLGRGIFAEVTLSYRDRAFQPLEHTYPDFRSPEYIRILNHIRSLYVQQIKAG